MKRLKYILGSVAALLISNMSFAQISGGNAYMLGDHVEIGVDANGMEGTNDYTPSNSRGGGVPGSYFGFVANPQLDGWGDYDGDFFTPGSPENGFGLDIDGFEFGNNASGPLYEIPTVPGSLEWEETDQCIIVDWEGLVDGIRIHVQYKLVRSELFYTTEITLINETHGLVNEMYYYRNFDPDNNQTIGGGFPTTNTIEEQPDGICDRAVVSATQTAPWPSFVGIGAIDPMARVSYGGFANRDGSDIWNATGLEGTEGATSTGDVAISLAYRLDDFDTGDTASFRYSIILDISQVDAAISSLYYFEYEGGFGGVIDDCNPVVDTAETCPGYPVLISVDGPDASGYTWEWDPPTDLSTTTGPTTEASPTTTTLYTVTGTPTSGCVDGAVSKDIVVAMTGGPQANYDDPGPQCGAFDITELVWYDTEGIPGTVQNFFTEIPDSASQTGPLFGGPIMVSGDEVYLVIADTATGCFSVIPVIIDWSGTLQAGNDSTMVICSDGGPVDVSDLVSPWANPLGVWDEVTSSGSFDASSSTFDPTGLGGSFDFSYTIVGEPPCPDDEAILTIFVNPTPVADFELTFGSGGPSSDDGANKGCIENPVFFFDGSSVISPGTITNWFWEFGDGATSTDVNPVHDYGPSGVGAYTVTLTVTTAGGCVHQFSYDIEMYDNPALDLIWNDPSCYGFNDGSASVNTSGGSGSYIIVWTNEAGDVINIGGSDAINSLSEGTYYVNVSDGTGCSGDGSVIITSPDSISIDYNVTNPLCHGDATGLIAVTGLSGAAGTVNSIGYFWAPATPCGEGIQADTACDLLAGTYTLTVNDANGCSQVIDIDIENPPALEFSEVTYEPALCRLYEYQIGNGQVAASGFGGTGDIEYLWENLGTGETSINTTWGGLNPGDYEITLTDDNGCTLQQIVTLDSLNPVADFEMTSLQMETATPFAGTAPMTVDFQNTSYDFGKVSDPLSDTTGWWNFEAPNGDWLLYEDHPGYDSTYTYTYDEEGTYQACLRIQNKNGCEDENCKEIIVYAPVSFTSVNVFTPDGDGVNDVFTFRNFATSIVEFNCIIVDRWGTRKYEMTDITDGWDGTDRTGSTCRDGVYFYTYTATSQNGTVLEGQGTVQILNSGAK